MLVAPSRLGEALYAYYRDLGFGIDPNRVVVVDGPEDRCLPERLMADAEALAHLAGLLDAGPAGLDTFASQDEERAVHSHLQETLRRDIRFWALSAELDAQVNRKDTARERAVAMSIPVPPGASVRVGPAVQRPDWSRLEAAIRTRIATSPGGVVVKGAVGALGSATYLVDEEAQIESVLHTIADRPVNDTYLVEERLHLSGAPNVTVWIEPDDGSISVVSVTNQRLSGSLQFVGSEYPSGSRRQPEILASSGHLADHLQRDLGVTGWVGFDFGEYRVTETDTPMFFFSEINARFNGGLYAKAAFDLLRDRQAQRGAPLPAAYVTETRLGSPIGFDGFHEAFADLHFDPRTGSGILLLSPGALGNGKVAVLCLAGSLPEASQVAEAFRGTR